MRFDDIPFTYRHVPEAEFPVLLLPGLMGGDWIWRTTIEELTVVGYGTLLWNVAVAQIERPGSGSVVAQLADAAAALLDQLSIDQALVCGNSLGALIALEFATKHPDRAKGLVLSGCPGLEHDVIGLDYVVSHSEREIAEQYRDRMFHVEPDWLPLEFIEESMDMAAHKPTMARILRAFRAARSHDTLGALADVACPASLIWGEQDQITPFDDWRPHLDVLKGADVHVVPECGHSPMIERPEIWMDLLLDFARGLAGPADPDPAAADGAAATS